MSVWNEQSRRWKHVGLPTRPSPEDSEIMSLFANKLCDSNEATHIVILGVTPEVIQLNWPEGSTISAVDMNRWMIDTLFSPHERFPTAVYEARWQSMPMKDNSIDLIAGDGIFTPLESVMEYNSFFREMKRIIKPGGSMIIRAFIRPDISEDIDAVIDDAVNGKIKHFGSLKWRIAMALVEDGLSVRPSEIYRIFQLSFPDRNFLSSVTGWHMDTIATIDSYKDMDSVFTFPTLDELKSLSKEFTKISDISYASYELSERCPTIVFEF